MMINREEIKNPKTLGELLKAKLEKAPSEEPAFKYGGLREGGGNIVLKVVTANVRQFVLEEHDKVAINAMLFPRYDTVSNRAGRVEAVAAIKYIRLRFSIGLKEAKDLVDNLRFNNETILLSESIVSE